MFDEARISIVRESLKLLDEANNYSIRHYESATGMETWFTLPDLKTIIAPPKWKMAIVVFIGHTL
jgi:antibiotic biosynthesis monooxygenase (ABM) superfamily enzyme